MTTQPDTLYTIAPDDAGQRLDVWCVQTLPKYSRSALQRAILNGVIQINDTVVKPRYIVSPGDTVTIGSLAPPITDTTPPAPINPPILYEDNDVLVIDKPAGVVAHAGVGTAYQITLSEWLVNRVPTARTAGEAPERAGIVHRLDKDTSGVMIMAKHDTAYQHLKAQWQKDRIAKEYLALVSGAPKAPDGRIVRPIARSAHNPLRRTVDETRGKIAVTEWRKEATLTDPATRRAYALLRVFPRTGRTHQIRVHLHWLGYPIVGDHLYTFKRQKPPHGVSRQLLHAATLRIVLPNKQRHVFTAPLAADFQVVLDSLHSTDI